MVQRTIYDFNNRTFIIDETTGRIVRLREGETVWTELPVLPKSFLNVPQDTTNV